jgi:peptide/nickel transport system substrate-binding protein
MSHDPRAGLGVARPERARATPRRGLLALVLAGLVVLAAGAASTAGGRQNALAPKKGGTLKLLGSSDIFNLDPVSAYYTVSSLLERMFTRQLVSYANASSFIASQKIAADIATSVPTKGNGLSADGKTYTFHLRKGVMWNSSPPRQVTAGDFVREFKLLCNPASPVGAPGYYTSTIVGMAKYCAAIGKVKPTAAAISGYANAHPLPGVVAKGDLTLVFKLVKPAPDFLNILAMGFSSARPKEYDQYVPDSAPLRQHTLSDGPYAITSYTPTKSFVLKRNPAWQAGTDPLRKAWVDEIDVTEGLSSESVQQQIEAGTGDLEFDIVPPTQDIPQLLAKKDSRLIIGPSGPYDVDLGTYLALNQYAGPMKNKLVRQAVALAVDKDSVVKILGGKAIGTTTNQIILPGNVGYIPNFNPFPSNKGSGDPAGAKALLAKAGYPNGLPVKLLYSTSDPAPRVAQSLQSSLNAGGFKVTLVPSTQSDFYGKYLTQPSTAKRDVWDIAPPGWIPDWFGNNGRSTIQPLYTQPGTGSNDFGGYDNPKANKLIDQALTARSTAQAAKLWAQANSFLAKDVANVPINMQKWPLFHSTRLQGCTIFFFTLTCDPTNVWIQ